MSAQDTTAWTDDRTERLRVLWTSGISAREIAKQLGITRSAAIGKANRMGLPKHEHTNWQPSKDLPAFADLIAEGSSIRAAADRLRLSYESGRRLFARMCRDLGWQSQ